MLSISVPTVGVVKIRADRSLLRELLEKTSRRQDRFSVMMGNLARGPQRYIQTNPIGPIDDPEWIGPKGFHPCESAVCAPADCRCIRVSQIGTLA
jgi:hypothetical protein